MVVSKLESLWCSAQSPAFDEQGYVVPDSNQESSVDALAFPGLSPNMSTVAIAVAG
jgi:hypothetical protein